MNKKIQKAMLELLYAFVENKKPIIMEYRCLGMHYKLTFTAEDLNNE
jgi:hypothetical protein